MAIDVLVTFRCTLCAPRKNKNKSSVLKIDSHFFYFLRTYIICNIFTRTVFASLSEWLKHRHLNLINRPQCLRAFWYFFYGEKYMDRYYLHIPFYLEILVLGTLTINFAYTPEKCKLKVTEYLPFNARVYWNIKSYTFKSHIFKHCKLFPWMNETFTPYCISRISRYNGLHFIAKQEKRSLQLDKL